VVQRYWRIFNFQSAPQVHLRLQAVRQAGEGMDSGAAMPLPRSVEPVAPVYSRERHFVEYVHARARRVDATFGSASAPVTTPVARVVCRLAPAASTRRTDAASPEDGTHIARRVETSPAAPRGAVAAAPAIDVERLTEQVIKGIDRRIIAQRERFGRL
jgi:hypothetical protein